MFTFVVMITTVLVGLHQLKHGGANAYFWICLCVSLASMVALERISGRLYKSSEQSVAMLVSRRSQLTAKLLKHGHQLTGTERSKVLDALRIIDESIDRAMDKESKIARVRPRQKPEDQCVSKLNGPSDS